MGVGAFLRWWLPSTVCGVFNLFMATTGGVWIIPSFSNLGLCAVCWARFMCHHELWPTSVDHPFSFLNSSWGLTGAKHYQKISITIFRFVLQNFAIPGYFPYRLSNCLYRYISIYIKFLASNFERSLPRYIEICRVGDNRRTVNTSTSP